MPDCQCQRRAAPGLAVAGAAGSGGWPPTLHWEVRRSVCLHFNQLHSHSNHTRAALDTPRPMSRAARPLGAALAACLLLCVSARALELQPGDRMPDGEPPAAAAAAAAAAFQAAATTDPYLAPLPGTLQTWWCPP